MQFYGVMAEKDVVNVEDVSAAAFGEYLQFFYKEEVTLSIENIEAVLNLAKQSLIDDLVDECEQFLLNMVGLDKLIWCYRLALRYEIKSLEKFCAKQIDVNIKTVFQSADFLSCEREMLCNVLDFDSLNCNETDVLDACVAWADKKCDDEGIDGTNTVNLRAALGEALFKIRFCSMTAEQFATINEMYAKLLSSDESTEVFQAILSKAKGKPSSTFGEFNSKPRREIPLNLECSFYKGAPIRRNNSLLTEVLRFRCNKAIYLTGFVCCNEMNVDRLNVFFFQSQKKCVTESILDNCETKITFNEPIQSEAGELYEIFMLWSNNLKSPAKWYEYNLQRRVETNGVSFNFESEVSIITRLLFNINTDEPRTIPNIL